MASIRVFGSEHQTHRHKKLESIHENPHERGGHWKLRLFIGLTALIHLAGFIFVVAKNKTQHVPLTKGYVMWPHGSNSTHTFSFGTEPATKIDMESLVGAFFLLSAIFQGVPAILFWPYYVRNLTVKCIQPFRWVEYSFSASCLFVLGILINGVFDFYHVLVVFFAMWTVMMLGLLQEERAYTSRLLIHGGHDQGRWVAWEFINFVLPHLIGWALYISLWYESLDRFQLAMKHTSPDHPPKWVVSFYYFLFSVFSSFGINQAVQMVRLFRRRKTAGSIAGIAIQHEYVYVILSAVAKTISAYFLYTGLLASSSAGHY